MIYSHLFWYLIVSSSTMLLLLLLLLLTVCINYCSLTYSKSKENLFVSFFQFTTFITLDLYCSLLLIKITVSYIYLFKSKFNILEYMKVAVAI